ncbi:MAG: LolA-related protein [Burkholderiaceae bacterium]
MLARSPWLAAAARRSLAGVLALVLTWPFGIAPALAAAFDLDALLAGMAALGPRQVAFQEQRDSPLLQTPMQSSGVLIYERGGKLIKQVIAPHYSRFEIEDDQLLVSDGMTQHRIMLDEHPALRGFVAAYRATLAGDRATLLAHFDVRLEGGPAAWQLRLAPRDAALRSMLERVTLTGHDNMIETITTEQSDGTRSLMRVTLDSHE